MTPSSTPPPVVRTREDLARARAYTAGRVAFVPTMGALHEGHRALLRRARELGDAVVVSVFVNPLQFGPSEDLDRYPRTFDEDLRMCADEGVNLVFAPTTDVMYPSGQQVTVHAGPMGDRLEGTHRPGHFDGVLTVVLKLFHLVAPDVALFGQKDAQQLAVVRSMVDDLNVPVDVVGVPTVREPDGLARSSRNRYLTPDERATALALSRALREGAARAAEGAGAVRHHARAVLDDATRLDPPLVLDYLALVDPATFTEVDDAYAGQATLAVAGRIGATRLIDNLPVTLAGTAAGSGALASA